MQRRRLSLSVRIGLAFFCVLASLTLAITLVIHLHQTARAADNATTSVSPAVEYSVPSGTYPWGTTFDSNGNVWVALPGCDANPTCPTGTPPGQLAEFNPNSQSWVHTYTLPAGFTQPLFLAFDQQGNLWFPMPMGNALGMFNPQTATFKQWTVPTAAAGPWDVAVDHNGNIWFTEHFTNQIGEFNPSTQQFTEIATPAASSQPYGITVDGSNNIWFTENNPAVALIGEYTAQGQLKEYKIRNNLNASAGLTPHLITVDHSGNIWWSEGWASAFGELNVAQAVPGTNNGVTEYSYQQLCSTCTGSHTSGIAVDDYGNVWFDDSLQSEYGYMPVSGGNVTVYALTNTNAHTHDGLNIDSQNRVWFTEEFANKLAEVTQTGTPLPSPSPSPTIGTTPTSTPSSSVPVNKLWYFAEGRVGKGFEEYLTIDNPSTTSCAVSITYSYTMDGSTTPLNKTVNVTVSPTSRLTEPVNADLGISPTTIPAAIVSVVGQVSSATPNCPGVVMERPMYFHTDGIESGDDVIGATHLSTTFYFADVPTGPNYSSYITILNPNSTATTVTVKYYANSTQVGTQTTSVPANARGTITPMLISLPTHVTAIVTSTQPVMVERPTYFKGAMVNGVSVSGGYDVVGVSTLANDWLFAEGYTGSSTQENLTLANPTTTAANVVITLESQSGATQAYSLTLGPMAQTIFNVNAYNTFAHSTPQVSIEVTSTGSTIVAQREEYFTYNHKLYNGRDTQTVGGTDVIGEVGPASHSVYSFAEGYNNVGYNEWLTVQNPTATNTTIEVILVNGYGRTYTAQFPVPAHSRFTQDITSLVLQTLVHPGDDHRGYEVSMTVLSLNGTPITVERPMYWNTSGSSFATLGGSDVIGYVGQ